MPELSRPGTHIVLSGILVEQVEALAGIYSGGFRLLDPHCRAEWILIEGIRTDVSPQPARR